MKMSKLERLFLVNQLRILEALYPDEAVYYARHRKAVEEGYTLHYSWVAEHLYDEMSEDECREVLDILDMYRAIGYFRRGHEMEDIDKDPFARFAGFDGNNETRQLAYVRYFMDDLDRYSDLRVDLRNSDLNSHVPMLSFYRRMLVVWRGISDRFDLTLADVQRILQAVHGSNK